MTENHEQLMLKVLLATATPEEEEAFGEWLSADPANAKAYEDYKKIWAVREKDVPSYTAEKEWSKLEGKLKTPKVRSIGFYFREAAAVLLLCVASYLLYQGLKDRPEVYRSGDKLTTVTLSDGTEVILKPNSELVVASDFGDNLRYVGLSGKAFFKVSHDASKPFTVDGGESKIEVLGTSFSVDSDRNSDVEEVVVITGKVRMSRSGGGSEDLILLPGVKGSLARKSNKLTMSQADTTLTMKWRNRKLVFRGTPLKDVVPIMADYFDVKITLKNTSIAQCRFTSTFDDPVLDEVIDALRLSLDLTVQRDADAITLDGQSCQ